MKQVPVRQQSVVVLMGVGFGGCVGWGVGGVHKRICRLNFEFGMITVSNQHDTAHIHTNKAKHMLYVRAIYEQ